MKSRALGRNGMILLSVAVSLIGFSVRMLVYAEPPTGQPPTGEVPGQIPPTGAPVQGAPVQAPPQSSPSPQSPLQSPSQGGLSMGEPANPAASPAQPTQPAPMPGSGTDAPVGVMPSPPPAPVSIPAGATVSNYKKFRDPFQEVMGEGQLEDKRPELERFATMDFKLTGVSTGPLRMRAILVSPKGKSFIVNEGMHIGLREGVIKKITTKSVVVVEKSVNEIGEIETAEVEIPLDVEEERS